MCKQVLAEVFSDNFFKEICSPRLVYYFIKKLNLCALNIKRLMNVVQENLLKSKVEIQTCDPCVNRTPQAYTCP